MPLCDEQHLPLGGKRMQNLVVPATHHVCRNFAPAINQPTHLTSREEPVVTKNRPSRMPRKGWMSASTCVLKLVSAGREGVWGEGR